jgi:hypothetical protein
MIGSLVPHDLLYGPQKVTVDGNPLALSFWLMTPFWFTLSWKSDPTVEREDMKTLDDESTSRIWI